ncbi:hypothetical protein LQW54_003576 [Pestalotiopsis sp. IQ-011]
MAGVLQVIAQWDYVPDRLHPPLRGYTLAAAPCHDPSLVEISPEQLLQMAERVFSGNWNTNQSPQVPYMEAMSMSLGSIRVGKFREDLPPSPDKQATWDKKHNPDAPSRLLVDTSRTKAPQTHAARKKGKPAYFRARLDKTFDRITTEFIDATGKLAPAAYVELDNGTDKLTRVELLNAYNQADQSRAKIVKDYNADLCAYLWQKVLYNSCRYDNFWKPVQPGVVDYIVDDFAVPPLVANQYRRIREQTEWIEDRPPRRESLF